MKARLPQGMGGGPGNMNQMIRQAQKMQEEIAKVQAELEEKEYAVTGGGGMIEVKINGKKEITLVKLNPEIVDPEDIEMLEDMITAAVNEAIRTVEKDAAAAMGKVTGGLGAGMGLGI